MNQPGTSITVETFVHAPLQKVWDYWTLPQHIEQWNAASDDWHALNAKNDLRPGGVFSCRMEARDKSFGFEFEGTHNEIIPLERISSTIGDGRKMEVQFIQEGEAVHVKETFELERENSEELQRNGWQAILDRFRTYTETH